MGGICGLWSRVHGGDATRCARPVRPGVDDLSFLTFEESDFVFSAICGLSDIESVTQRILFLDSLFLLSFYQFFQLSTHYFVSIWTIWMMMMFVIWFFTLCLVCF